MISYLIRLMLVNLFNRPLWVHILPLVLSTKNLKKMQIKPMTTLINDLKRG